MYIKETNLKLLLLTTSLLAVLFVFQIIQYFGLIINIKLLAQVFCVVILLLFSVLFRRKIFEPYLFIPFVTLLYGFAGGINFINRGAVVDFYNEKYFLLFVFWMLVPITILSFCIKPESKERFKKKWVTDGFAIFILDGLIYFGLFCLFLDWLQIGAIPLLGSSSMRKGSEPILRLFFILSIFLTYFKCFIRPKRSNYFLFAFIAICALFSAYRTSLFFILILGLFWVAKTDFFERNIKKIIILFMVLFFSMNLVKLYRDINRFGLQHYYYIMDQEKLPRSYILFSPIIHTVREGPQIFQQIRNNTSDFGEGAYLMEHISTVLPGKQRNYGQIYNNLTDSVTNNTKTGTILSPFYIDFGVVGICALAFILGTLNIISEIKSRNSPYSNLLYMFFIAFELTWIHGGAPFSPTFLLDYIILFSLQPILKQLK